MDANVVMLIRQEMIRRGVIDPNDVSVVSQREKGRKFSFEDHLRALIYALLTNQRKWSDVEPKLDKIDELFFHYDADRILTYNGEYFENGIRQLRCGNISIKLQMANLNANILTLKKIEKDYGSLDAYVTSNKLDVIVRELSSGRYKLKGIGPALAWEYLRNVGIDGAKPDTHLKRFIGSKRMGVSDNIEASDEEVLSEVKRLSAITGLSRFDIDYAIWVYCADGKEQICTSSPSCDKCVVKDYCRYKSNEVATKTDEIIVNYKEKENMKKGGEYRDQFFNEYMEYLRKRFDEERRSLNKPVYSDSTIRTYATDTFYLEKKEDVSFISWLKDEDSIKEAKSKLMYYLSGRENPEKDVEYYLNCMLMFKDFYYEITHKHN